MPSKRANVKNEKQYEALKKKGMSKSRAARARRRSDAAPWSGRAAPPLLSEARSGATRSVPIVRFCRLIGSINDASPLGARESC